MGAPGRNAAHRILEAGQLVPHDVVIIGGGHNGLVAAAVLAQGRAASRSSSSGTIGSAAARHRRDRAGVPRPSLAHRAALDPAIVRALGLERHGLELIALGRAACRLPRPMDAC